MEQLIKNIGEGLVKESALLAIAESCTGGWIAKSITDMSGSSQWFDRGFITYSNASKIDMLGVAASMLEKNGAVSEPVAQAMAVGVLANSLAEYSVSVTGIAGPSGGTQAKPVGMVCFGWASKKNSPYVETQFFEGSRDEIRYKSVVYALQGLEVRYFNSVLT